jgi:hypothetical protein
VQLGETLLSWKEEIATMWRFTRKPSRVWLPQLRKLSDAGQDIMWGGLIWDRASAVFGVEPCTVYLLKKK